MAYKHLIMIMIDGYILMITTVRGTLGRLLKQRTNSIVSINIRKAAEAEDQ